MRTCSRRAAQRQLRRLAVFRMSEAVSAGLGPTLVSPSVDLRPATVFVPVVDLLLHRPDADGIRAERGARETTSARPHRETRAEDEAARVAQVGTTTVALSPA